MPRSSTAEGESWRARWALRENERRRAEYDVRDQRWQAELGDLDRMLAAARTFEGEPPHPGSPLVPKRGERVHLALPDVTMVEGSGPPPRPLPADSPFSYVQARVIAGSAKGGTAALPEGLRVVDRGPVTLTDRRVVFHGGKHTREWSFAKLMGLRHEPGTPITLLQVSNRQKVSGVLYPATATAAWRFGLALALAVFRGDRQALVSALEHDRQVLVAQRPTPPPAALPEQAPAHLAVAHAVGRLYVGRPGQGAARRVTRGVTAAVVSLFAISVVAGLASGTTGTVTTEGAPISTVPSATRTPSSPSPSLRAAETSPSDSISAPTQTASPVPSSARPSLTVPAQPTRTMSVRPPTARATTTRTATKPPVRTARPTPKPKPTRVHVSLCGAPSNPWGFTFCTGSVIYTPPAEICGYLDCIPNFPNGHGYVVQCADGMFSKSGGRQGACSHHGGERRPLLK